MRFHFHQDVRFIAMKCESTIHIGKESLDVGTLHDRRIIRIRDNGSAWRDRFGISDHAKKCFVLCVAVDGP